MINLSNPTSRGQTLYYLPVVRVLKINLSPFILTENMMKLPLQSRLLTVVV